MSVENRHSPQPQLLYSSFHLFLILFSIQCVHPRAHRLFTYIFKVGFISKFSSVQLLSCVPLFVTPWTAACQASLSFTISWSLLKLMSVESVRPSNHLILCCSLLLLPFIFPSIRVFSNELALHIGGQNIGASASASVLPINIQG